MPSRHGGSRAGVFKPPLHTHTHTHTAWVPYHSRSYVPRPPPAAPRSRLRRGLQPGGRLRGLPLHEDEHPGRTGVRVRARGQPSRCGAGLRGADLCRSAPSGGG